MKRILLAAAAVAMLAACSKDEIAQDASNGPMQSIKVSVAPFDGDNATKTAVSPTGGFTWSAGDQIGIYPVATELGAGQTSQQIVFKINGTGDAKTATFTGTGWGLVTDGSYKYFSYYPYSAEASYDEAAVSYSDNLNQSANGSTSHLGCNDYLYAPQIQPDDAASAEFTFKHLSALVKFEITVPEEVKTKAFTRMTVTASEAVFTTSGVYDPSSATASDAPTITDNVYTDKLTLLFNGCEGFTPDANGKIHAYFLIAPAAVKDKTLSIKLWTEDNVPYVASKTPSKDLVSQAYMTYSDITATLKPTTTAVDLSTDGTDVKTANCYIVPEWGKFKFLANVKGNGVVPSGMSESSALDMTGCTAEVIWETVNTNAAPEVGTIVHDVAIEGDYIVFEATGAQGNALIALKDGSGNIIWSWHIWSTSADLVANKQTYGGANMMDRNLGALSATPGNGLTLGFHYQWGRPCPITGGCSDGGAFSSTRMATTGADDLWVEEETDATKGTLAYSAANPTHFIYTSASNYLSGTTRVSGNWLWTANDYPASASLRTLWGAAKTMYDPCPIGWKVPAGGSAGVWATAGFSTSTFTWNATEQGRTFTSANAYYPSAGYRGEHYTAQGGALNYVGDFGVYWSSTAGSVYGYVLNFHGNNYVSHSYTAAQAFGYSVRPCQE